VVLTILVGSVATAVCLLVGARLLLGLASERRQVAAAAAGYDDAGDQPLVDQANQWFRGTRAGRAVQRELELAGIDQRPIIVAFAVVGIGAVAAYVLWSALAPVFGVLGLGVGVLAVRAYIRRAKQRRLEAFIVQMPELARVLANATNAGLSIPTAIGVAGEELAAPAGVELQQVASSMRFGSDLESALDGMSARLPSREVAVLLSTLIVCARSGGSLVTSLRDIADTLEDRKETRREVRTTLAQSLATGYLVIGMGVGMLFLLNTIQPGSVEAMTGHPIGVAALVISGALFAMGFLLIRRMTRMDI
jgi:tight adherence protein B